MGNLWGISLQKALSGEECVSFDFILTAEKGKDSLQEHRAGREDWMEKKTTRENVSPSNNCFIRRSKKYNSLKTTPTVFLILSA